MSWKPPEELLFYLSQPHPCSYLEGRSAQTLFVDPDFAVNMELFNHLTLLGFRRSGNLVYIPRCESCSACLPIRLEVNAFRPNRSQKRAFLAHQELQVEVCHAKLGEEHFKLYQRYINARHPDGSMAVDDHEQERCGEFFLSRWAATYFIEFRERGELIAVAVVDEMDGGLSAVYTFFDPTSKRRGLGTFAILSQIELCRQQGLPWLYLGYLIHASPKMAYKARFRPYQILQDGLWHDESDH